MEQVALPKPAAVQKPAAAPPKAAPPKPASAQTSTQNEGNSDSILIIASIGILLLIGGLIFYYLNNQNNASGTPEEGEEEGEGEGEGEDEDEIVTGSCFSEYNKGTFNCPSNKQVNREKEVVAHAIKKIYKKYVVKTKCIAVVILIY